MRYAKDPNSTMRLQSTLGLICAFASLASVSPVTTLAQDEDRTATNNLVITRAVVDGANRVTITGENFLGNTGRRTPVASLERTPLATIGTPTSTTIVAQLP